LFKNETSVLNWFNSFFKFNISVFGSWTKLIKSFIISLSLFSSSFYSNTISFIFEEGNGIEIITVLVSSIIFNFSFSTLSFISSHISFKLSNW